MLNRPVPRHFYQELVDSGVDAELSRQLLLRAIHELPSAAEPSQPALLRAAEKAARSLIAIPSTRNCMPGKRVVAVIGPAGVGKTTSVAKLAAKLALEERKKIVLVSLDGYRIGALEQLRSYARLIGVPFRFVDQVSELPRVIEESRQKDFVLIDTAGRSPRELKSMQSLADFFRQSESIERHLVLSASTKPADMQRIVDQFEPCAPDHLLFTKLDETTTPGPILNELVRTQKSFSYYTDGQRVPEDLHAVPGRGVVEIILKRNESPLEV
jgi:flagellar biosynthesis protein FlhF